MIYLELPKKSIKFNMIMRIKFLFFGYYEKYHYICNGKWKMED